MTIALPYVAVLLFMSLVALLHSAGRVVDELKRGQVNVATGPLASVRVLPATP